MLLGAFLASFVFAPSVRGDEDVNIIIVDPNAPGAEVLHRDASVPMFQSVGSSGMRRWMIMETWVPSGSEQRSKENGIVIVS